MSGRVLSSEQAKSAIQQISSNIMTAGVDADVEFDFGVADGLASSCDNAATAVDGQAGSRASWTSTGLTDFKGHFFEPDDRSTQPPLGRLVHGCPEFGLP